MAIHHLLSAAIAVGVASGVVCATGAAAAAGNTYKIIVHPDNPIAVLDRRVLRDIYLRKVTDWTRGRAIRPIELSGRSTVREQFIHEVLRKTPAQLKTYWNQQIFSGKGVPPPEADSPASAVAYVLANPGAIAYVPVDADPGKTKVIKVQ